MRRTEQSPLSGQFEPGICDAQRVVQEMEDDEGEHSEAAEGHGSRRDLGLYGLGQSIRLRSGRLIQLHQGQSCDDVGHKTEDQSDPRDPEGLLVRMQKFSIRVNLFGAPEHLEIAHEMGDYETEEGEAGACNQPFFPNRGSPELEQKVHSYMDEVVDQSGGR